MSARPAVPVILTDEGEMQVTGGLTIPEIGVHVIEPIDGSRGAVVIQILDDQRRLDRELLEDLAGALESGLSRHLHPHERNAYARALRRSLTGEYRRRTGRYDTSARDFIVALHYWLWRSIETPSKQALQRVAEAWTASGVGLDTKTVKRIKSAHSTPARAYAAGAIERLKKHFTPAELVEEYVDAIECVARECASSARRRVRKRR